MRKIAIAGLVMAAVASTAPGARAGSDSTHLGGCSFLASDPVRDQREVAGEIDVEAVVHSPADPATPVAATITCQITVNGVPQPGALVAATGTVVVVGGGVVSYTTASADDEVELCQSVNFTGAGDTTPTSEDCYVIGPLQFPPPIIWEIWTPPVCPVLSALAGGYGPLVVNNQGDVYVNGEPHWDCPPYDIEWGS